MYLRTDVLVEPLVDHFPAWLHSVAPAPAADRLARVQVPRLEAYLRRPGADDLRSLEAAALLDVIKRDRTEMLALAAALADAERMLGDQPTGADLAGLHRRLPELLRGAAEVVYDGTSKPALRIVEQFFYDSAAYDTGRQSLRLTRGRTAAPAGDLDEPRLPEPDAVDLPVPFCHPAVDELVAARIRPIDPARLRAALGIDDWQASGLERSFTRTFPARPGRHLQQGARLRYFGRSCLVLQTPEVAVVTDPCLDANPDRTLDDLPDRIDLVLITSGRPGHLALGTLLQLRPRIGQVVVPRSARGVAGDPSIALCLRALGFPVVEVDDLDEIAVGDGRVVATPHSGGHDGRDVGAKSTYVLQMAGAAVFVGGSATGVDPALHRRLRARLGRVDMAFLGAASGDTAAVVAAIDADEAYLYGDAGPADAGIREFLRWCEQHGVTAEHLCVAREWLW
jgi:L-ascorbate metabolism protein UlaG (beta-lactamase superfamily)